MKPEHQAVLLLILLGVSFLAALATYIIESLSCPTCEYWKTEEQRPRWTLNEEWRCPDCHRWWKGRVDC